MLAPPEEYGSLNTVQRMLSLDQATCLSCLAPYEQGIRGLYSLYHIGKLPEKGRGC